MNPTSRKGFLTQIGLLGTSVMLFNRCNLWGTPDKMAITKGVQVALPGPGEDIFSYVKTASGEMDLNSIPADHWGSQ